MKYHKLTDELNLNEIIKEENGIWYRYQFGSEKWIINNIESNQYANISEQEAIQLLNKQRDQLDHLLKTAISVATRAHAGQVDKGGNPYILHPKAVSDTLESTENKIVAYLHDICEDTDTTFDDLLKFGFTNRIVNSVRVLTKTESISYDNYLKSVKKDNQARMVKIADIRHNMDITRIPNPSEKDYARIEKYQKAIAFLQKED